MKRVLIVEEGRWGNTSKENYKDQLDMFRELLDRVMVPIHGVEGKGIDYVKAIDVEVVPTAKEAEEIIKTAPVNQRVDAIIFISRGMEIPAGKIATDHPKTKVIVLTGDVPEGKVFWVDKGRLAQEFLKNIILYW